MRRAMCLFVGLFLLSQFVLGMMVRIDGGHKMVTNVPAMLVGAVAICLLLAVGLASPKFPE